MSRAPRTTKCQKEFIIHFLEENQILLGGKINPLELPRINGLWAKMTTELNQIGPPKSVKSWKDTISEMKTKVKRHAREIKYGYTGTGGGTAAKPLTPLEERLLALLSRLTIEGVGLAEAGGEITLIATGDTNALGTQNDDSITLIPDGDNVPSNSSDSPMTNVILIETIDTVGPDIQEPKTVALNRKPNDIPSQNATPCTRITSALRKERRPKKLINRVSAGGRVTSAIDTHDKHLADLTNSNYAIARAISMLAKVISKKR